MPYMMSIETTEGVSERHGFHLGTDEVVARQIVEDTYNGRVKIGLPTVTVALLDNKGRIEDVYDGRWHNELLESWEDEEYA